MSRSKNTSTGVLLHDVYSKVPNKFLLSVAVSKRARQIKDGVKPLVKADHPLIPVLVALDEIAQDKVRVSVRERAQREEELVEKMDKLFEAELQEAIEEQDSVKQEKDKTKATA